MKRILSFIISLILILSLAACGAPSDTQKTSGNLSEPSEDTQEAQPEEPAVEIMDEEIRRAIAYGLVPEEIQGSYDKAITFHEYCEMLTNFIRTYDGDSMETWEKTVALAMQSDAEMLREDGILATAFAMEHIGKVEYEGNDWSFFDTVKASADRYDYGLTWDYPLFPEWDKIAFEAYNYNYMQGGIILCAVDRSRVSGLAIYPYDFEEEGSHFKEKLSRKEAIGAVLRFAETEDLYANHIPLPEDIDFSNSENRMAEITFLAEERKQNILAKNDSIQCTETAYYISNSGNDNNDGTTPETAWATLDKVKSYPFQPGDGIYFERNGIWRGAVGYFENGITISAYGEGEKPRIYGSPENGADAGNWELYTEADGAKIWKYNGINSECAGIVLNDGENIAKRVYAWYDGTDSYDSADRSVSFDLKTALSEDLYFYCDIDFETQTLPYYPDSDSLSIQIYLRCDDGNPGELYNSIEFISKTVSPNVGTIVFQADGILDNICIMYNAGTAVSMTEFDNCTIQNCEFGWCGTRLEQFFVPEEDEPGIWTDGNVIQLIGSNCTVQDNYIHDVDGGGIVLELGGDISDRAPFIGNTFCGNLIERCGDPIYIRNNDDDEIAEAFGEMTVDDNYVIDTGYGWYENQPSYINPAFYNGHSRNTLNFYGESVADGQSIRVTNNIFCRSYYSLMYFSPTTDIPSMEGNLYMQNYGKTVVEMMGAMVKATQADETQEGLISLDIDAGKLVVLPR